MFEFLKRHKVKDRKELHRKLAEAGHVDLPHYDSDEFDRILPKLLTDEVISGHFSAHFEMLPDAATEAAPADYGSSAGYDSGGSFDSGGGESGGGGASGDY